MMRNGCPVFVFRLGMENSLPAIQAQFPGGKLSIIHGYQDTILARIYDLAP
jgi:hypothetical protein